MTKILKIIARSLYEIIEWIMIILIFVVFAIRISAVQTYLATIATDYLSKELNTTVSIEKLDVVFFDRVDLKGFLLLNQNQTDTIASVNSLLVNIGDLANVRNKLIINSLDLEGGIIKIEKEKITNAINLKFIIDYFKSDKPKKKKDPIPIILQNLYLKDIRFHFNNQMIDPVAEGMDYQHLLLSNVNLDARDILFKNGVIT